MNSLQVNCFLEAAKCKSFSKSAANLFVSQPTFSRNIATLEEELGLTLFRRNSFHGIELTESGKILAEALSAGRKTLMAAIEKARQIEHEACSHLTLGLLEGQLLDDKLGDLITGFRMSFRNVTVSIKRDTYQGLMRDLESGEVDIVYMPQWQFSDNDRLRSMKISDIDTLLVIPKRLFPEPEERIYSIAEFSNFPFITVNSQESSRATTLLYDMFGSLGITPSVIETESLQKQIEKAEMGEGILLINPNNSICYSPNVYCIKIKELQPQPFAVAWKKDPDSESVKLFQHFLQMNRNKNKLTL